MVGLKVVRRKAVREEAEKPFWISFSDLMTALMVLFLVAMAVALTAVTQEFEQLKKKDADRDTSIEDRNKAIEACIEDVKSIIENPEFKGVRLDGNAIVFGTLTEFQFKSHDLSLSQKFFVRRFIPRVLEMARRPSCEAWLKRIVVEGFASQEGSYLYNLNLSFLRSQRILCLLLDPNAPNALSTEDRKQIRRLFLAGGSSFNSAKSNPEETRRVELRLEFHQLGEEREAAREIPWDEDSKCPNDLR
jgi:outer membrane protein OmpA-like peptidoglycan-associated protein